MNITPAVKNDFSIGSIVFESWGYDQTNIDFYVIVKKAGQFVTVQPMSRNSGPMSEYMSRTEEPGEVRQNAKPMRRKMRYNAKGEEIGFTVSYGWTHPYDGKPKTSTHYA